MAIQMQNIATVLTLIYQYREKKNSELVSGNYVTLHVECKFFVCKNKCPDSVCFIHVCDSSRSRRAIRESVGIPC